MEKIAAALVSTVVVLMRVVLVTVIAFWAFIIVAVTIVVLHD